MKAELLEVFGNDLMVANTARVSFNRCKPALEESDKRLIAYLAKHGHWSPFSHPKAQFRITAPIFVARQWEKHRVGCIRGYDIYDHNEVSRRYVESEPEFYTPGVWRSRPDGSIKQGSGSPLDRDANGLADSILADFYISARHTYMHLLKAGVAPEQARMILPQSMYTSWIETGSLAYWARLCRQRLDSHAQQEIADLAELVSEAMAAAFPISWEELMR